MKSFVGITKTGEQGVRHIVEDGFDVQAWAVAEAAEMVAAGYVRLIVTPYVPTRIMGDKRGGR